MNNKLSQSDIDRVIEMAWEDRTTFADIRKQFGIQEKEVIKLMKENMKRSSFLMWRKRVRGRKTERRKERDKGRGKLQINTTKM